ncbi:uncharacterized protein DNG_00550 [Cephalotrichum gorgonifer]|uniref:F-box domain-containing protein n=1 Tax=Cephalotrichum gorgonifer TaxID=2041049 RepID=A0AAE8MQI5_9PEZI|nr:uncharacterized protein DNG_00550 [Cephalotrichum gorgonifer]
MSPTLRPRKQAAAPAPAPAPKSGKRSVSSTASGLGQDEKPSKRARFTRTTALSYKSSASASSERSDASQCVFGVTELMEKILLECDQETLLTSACRVSTRWHSVIQTSTLIQQALFFLPIHENPKCSMDPLKNPILEKHFAYFFSSRNTSQCHHIHGLPEMDFYTMFDVRIPPFRAEAIDPNAQHGTGTRDHPVDLDRVFTGEGDTGDDDGDGDTKNTSETNGPMTTGLSSQGDKTPVASTNTSDLPDSSCPRHSNPQPAKWRPVAQWPTRDTAKLERYLREGASWRRMLVRQPPVKRLAYAERTLVDVNYAVHPHYDYYKALLESPTTTRAVGMAALPMSITTPANVATGGLRMDALYDTVHLNLSRMTIKDPAEKPEETYLESRFHVCWSGVPKSLDCPDDRMRTQIRRAVGKAAKETVVVQILAVERPLNHRMPATLQLVRCFGTRFRSQEAVGDPHFVHKRGTHAITGPDWLKKKWVSDRIDDAGFLLHWTDMSDELDEFDEFDDFDAFLFQELLDHHMMGLDDYLDTDHDFGWDPWDEQYLD